MSLMSVAVSIASHTSHVSTVYLLYLFVLLLLIVFARSCKMYLLYSDRRSLDMTPFFTSFTPTFEDDTSRAWWYFFHSSRICAQDGRKVRGVRFSSLQLLCKKA
jgi:hypothetical protein